VSKYLILNFLRA